MGNLLRTGRSGVNSRLAAVRDKDHGMYSVPSAYGNNDKTTNDNMYGAYVPPASGSGQESSDASLARELQSVEVTSISAAIESDKLDRLVKNEASAQKSRTSRSGQS